MRTPTVDQFSAATAAALAMQPFPPGSFGLNGMNQLGESLGLVLPPNVSGPPQQQSAQQSAGTPPTQHRQTSQSLQQQQQQRQQSGDHSSYIDAVNKSYSSQQSNRASHTQFSWMLFMYIWPFSWACQHRLRLPDGPRRYAVELSTASS